MFLVVKNGTDFNVADDEEVGGIMEDEDGHLEESKYTTASNATHAENDVSGVLLEIDFFICHNRIG